MVAWSRQIFSVERYSHSLDRDRARLVYGVTTLMLIGVAFFIVAVPTWQIPNSTYHLPLILALPFYPIQVLLFTTFLAIGVAGFWLTRQGYVEIAAWIPSAMIYMITAGTVFVSNVVDFGTSSILLALIFTIILSGLLQGYRGVALSLLVVITTFLTKSDSLTNSERFPILLIFVFAGGVAAVYNRFMTISRTEGAQNANDERRKFANIVSEVTLRASQRAPLSEVLNLTINRLLEKYPQFYHAQVFLIDDEGISAQLVASTGEVGQKLLARAHGLAIGSMSVIGQVTLQGQPRIERAGAPNTIHKFNDLLPETKIEAAFPLRTEDKVIGALDLQCRSEYAFTEEDKPTFQSLADIVALVIDNVRQFEIAQQRVLENQKLAEQARTALRDNERLNKRLTGRAWTEFLKAQRRDLGIALDLQEDVQEQATEWTTTLAQAAEANHLIQDRHTIALPLKIRGQVIGAMEFELDDAQSFSPEDLELVQEISERFGLAAENTRLVEESQRVAQREAMINEISTRLQGTNTVEATLTEAARSLRETLQAQRVRIRLGTVQRK